MDILTLLRRFRQHAQYCTNDAWSCYYQILFLVVYLTLQIFGVPKKAPWCSVDTLCKMKHFVQTTFGDSKTYYYGDKKWELEEMVYPHGNEE